MADEASNGGRRALVVANEAVSGEELRESLIGRLAEGTDKVFVVAPALADSALKHYAGDVDGSVGPAGERLRQTLDELREAGIDAEGEVGDSDPMIAIGDEIQKFGPDQIFVVGHRDEEGAFAEQGLLEQAQRDLDLPVTELVVERGADPHVLDVETTTRGAGRDRGWRPSRNLPPLTALNVTGIFVAIVGTVVLGVLAGQCVGDAPGNVDHEEGRLIWPCAARILIAIAFALINLAHVVGLFIFQSVRYEGIFSRFFARLSLIGTPVAIGVSLLLAIWM